MGMVSSITNCINSLDQSFKENKATRIVLIGLSSLALLALSFQLFGPNAAVGVICSLVSISGAASAGLNSRQIRLVGLLGLACGLYFAPAIIAKEAAQAAHTHPIIIF